MACPDVNLLINNAGVMLKSPMLAEGSEDALRREMEVNVYGVLAMVRAFAPILARNGGGAIVNMLSVVSWFVNPFNATYCASKHAASAVTDALRIQLKAQGTHVVGVYAGFIDTDMAARVNAPKPPPGRSPSRRWKACGPARTMSSPTMPPATPGPRSWPIRLRSKPTCKRLGSKAATPGPPKAA